MGDSHIKCRRNNYLVNVQFSSVLRLTSHFSDALFPRLPDLIKYSLPVPSEMVTHVEDEKYIEAQRRSS